MSKHPEMCFREPLKPDIAEKSFREIRRKQWLVSNKHACRSGINSTRINDVTWLEQIFINFPEV